MEHAGVEGEIRWNTSVGMALFVRARTEGDPNILADAAEGNVGVGRDKTWPESSEEARSRLS